MKVKDATYQSSDDLMIARLQSEARELRRAGSHPEADVRWCFARAEAYDLAAEIIGLVARGPKDAIGERR